MKLPAGRSVSGTTHLGHGALAAQAGSAREFERRLVEMTRERKERLAQSTGFEEQQKLHREVEAFEARLARCRHALARIENVLARLTR